MAKSNRIYLDYASSALQKSANPGAIHALGVKEKQKLEDARRRVARILGANNDEIIFTSGATESNNITILGLPKGHIVTTNIEHASVLETCKHRGNVIFVEVEKNGIVDSKKIKKALTKETMLVSVSYANNEIGTIQPISEIAKEIRHYNKKNMKKIFFHTDATQAINYLPIKIPKLGVDLMSFNGAKIYGPQGVGILYVKKNTPISKIMFGGDQERGLRPGTENVTGAVALAFALEATEKIKEQEVKRLTKLRDYFIKELSRTFFFSGLPASHRQPFIKESSASFIVNGDLKNRLPNNVNITIPNIPSDLLVIELSTRGIMASAKSACKAGDGKASHVIQAINPQAKDTDGSLRFSLGRETTKKDIDYTIKSLTEILQKLKKWYN